MVLATVAIHHVGGHAQISCLRFTWIMDAKSEYFLGLSADSRSRYERKVISAGLKKDPYAIDEWTENPETIPSVQWSDMVLYMIVSPSPYTREEIKVVSSYI